MRSATTPCEKLAYDAALASLDLAVLWLEAGRTAEVKELALGMAWIFASKKIHREAVAALTIFRDAARQEAATAELARRLVRCLYKAQHDPALVFAEAGGRHLAPSTNRKRCSYP